MNKITWQYLAGFFDGEGCIYFGGGDTHGFKTRVTIVQTKDKGHQLLLTIQDFLRVHGIVTRVRERRRASRKAHWSTCYYLYMDRRDSIVALLSGMLPFLHIKRVIAQDTLRGYKMFPSLMPYKSCLMAEGRMLAQQRRCVARVQ